jgi:superfamily I DNA and/or RNA helicase/very-short-patch-repair endonuclease
MDSVQTKVNQVFQYLRELKKLNYRIQRKITEFEKHWWREDLADLSDILIHEDDRLEADQWIIAHRPDLSKAPDLPIYLHGWISAWENPDQQPEPIPQLQREDRKEAEAEYELFTDDQARKEAFEHWLTTEWIPWSTETKEKLRAKRFYDELFQLYHLLQDEGDSWEIVWGQGLLTWEKDDVQIQRHLLTTPLELHFDAEQGLFLLCSTSRGTRMETDMLLHLDIPNLTKIQEMNKLDVDPKNRDAIALLFTQVANLLSSEGRWIEEGEPVKQVSSHLSISYSPAIFIRKTAGRVWDAEFQNIVQQLEQNYPIPESIRQLVSLGDNRELDAKEWAGLEENLLFPLPANQEQKEIVQKLARSASVVVQGPPGTGKSHTIANLICHLLAHGKRVLVTSEKERALEVIRDKIPAEIRDLCVSVLGGDSKSMKELENSIRAIADNFEQKDVSALNQSIQLYQKEWEGIRSQIAVYQERLNDMAEKDNEEKWVEGKRFKPIDASKWVSEHKDYGWLPDSITPGTKFPLSTEELEVLYRFLNKISVSELANLHWKTPDRGSLPEIDVFRNKAERFHALDKQFQAEKHYIKAWKIPERLSFSLEALIQQNQKNVNLIRKISQANWKVAILTEIIQHPAQRDEWIHFFRDYSEQLQQITQIEKQLLEYEIQLPKLPEQKMLEDIEVILERINHNKSTGWMFKKTAGKKYAYLFEECFIDGLPIEEQEDFALVKQRIIGNQLKKKFQLKWNRIMEQIDGPLIDSGMSRWSRDVWDALMQIETIIQWEKKIIEPLTPLVQLLVLQEVEWTDANWFADFHHGLSVLHLYYQLKDIENFFSRISSEIEKERGAEEFCHPAWDNLQTACEQKDAERWEATIKSIARLETIQHEIVTYQQLKTKLAEVCPIWCDQIASGHLPSSSQMKNIEKAWLWSQLNHWLHELQQQKSVEEIEKEIQLAYRKESVLISKLAAELTWKIQLEQTDEQQKRSLTTWMQMTKKLGKGTGKYASKYRKSASKEMNNCKKAIPVWIMPLQRVVENIELTNDLFDVVIVDESSQSNLFALSALLRAKKAVIVGDDNQISPETVGLDRSQNHELIKQYLKGIPQADQLELSTSLYDTASRVFANSKVILKEHFRCVPEIIQFSNDLMYGGQMDPLRLPFTKDLLDRPVYAVEVKDGCRRESSKVCNEPEAAAITDFILQCSQDEKYKGKSMGVISLQGYDQAQLIEQKLRETLGEREMKKRNLICGDAYRFQGTERDIIFLSMVAANNVPIGVLNKEADRRRFNVAASRARDQMILFHSVGLKDLNPNCMRYHLLEYCLYPNQMKPESQDVGYLFETTLEKDVYQKIAARGYRVSPQVQVGNKGKRIDLVIEGTRNRLAVECDGDQWRGRIRWEADIERQRILERVGWKFWRIRGSEFYRDPEKALRPLWQKLEEMRIFPVQEPVLNGV